MSSLDAAACVSCAQQQAVQSQIDVAVMKKQLDAMRAQGDAAVALIQGVAAQSKAAGRGEAFDASA